MKNESQPLSIGIFADLIGLQNLPSRGQLLGRLRMLIDKINTTFHDTIKVDFMIISDTEFKAAVDRIFPMQDFLALYDEEFGKDVGTHFGIGLGVLGPPQEKEPGGCFYAARGAMTQARKSGQYVVFQGFEVNEAISALFHFIHEMNEAMTERQRKIVDVYRKSGDIVSVSSELYLPKQAVFDSIKAAKYDVYSAAWRGLQELLKLDVPLPPAAAGGRPQQQQRYQQQRPSSFRSKGYQRESSRGYRDREGDRGHRDREPNRPYRDREAGRGGYRDHETGRGQEQGRSYEPRRSHESTSGYDPARGNQSGRNHDTNRNHKPGNGYRDHASNRRYDSNRGYRGHDSTRGGQASRSGGYRDRESGGGGYRDREPNRSQRGDEPRRDYDSAFDNETGRDHKPGSGYRSARGGSQRPRRPGPKNPRPNKPWPSKPGPGGWKKPMPSRSSQ